jgi:hypothetical protein
MAPIAARGSMQRRVIASIGLDCRIGAILAIVLGFALIFERCTELQSRSRFTD